MFIHTRFFFSLNILIAVHELTHKEKITYDIPTSL